MLHLTSSYLTLELDPGHGGEVRSLVDCRTGAQLLWLAPWQAQPPRSGPLTEEDWTSCYRGGWQELFPNAGNPCIVDERFQGFHGEASNSPWHVLEAQEDQACLRWSNGELSLERTVRLAKQRATVYYEERIINIGPVERAFLWHHHPAFGGPLLDPYATIDLPAGRAYPLDEQTGPIEPPPDAPRWPYVGGEDWSRVSSREPSLRFGCVTDFSAGWAALRNDVAGIGLALAWPIALFPHLWLYQDVHMVAAEPWRHAGEFVMLEPARTPHSLGLATAIAHGQALRLAPGASLTSWLTVTLFRPGGPVTHVARDGSVTPEVS